MNTATTSAAASTVTVAVGDGMTLCGYSDREAYTVIAVSASGKMVTLQRDKATLLNGANSGEADALKVYPGGFACHTEGTQRYSYEADPNGRVVKASLRGNGKWILVGEPARGGTRAILGRHENYDFNF